jgi:hypothetical protein
MIITPRAEHQKALNSAIDSCHSALQAPLMRETSSALRSLGLSDAECVALVERVQDGPGENDPIVRLRTAISSEVARLAAIEQYLLLLTAVRYRSRFEGLSMSQGVLRLLADELRFLADPPERDRANLLAPTSGFVSMAKVVTLRRFPAGQLHFELSGIPLSWFPGLAPWRLTKVLFFLARHARGRRRPFYFHHVAWRRQNRLFLTEAEQNRSYVRIAQSLALHPEVNGLLTASWLHATETFCVSPHLAWLNKPFQEAGGLVVRLGDASESSGVFAGGAQRRQLYEQGRFRPTTALVIWPRSAMLEWAARHPEFAEQPSGESAAMAGSRPFRPIVAEAN